MTFLSRVRSRVRRCVEVTAVAVAAAGLAAGLAGCGADSPDEKASESRPAPVLGENDDRIQLTEGVPYSTGTGGADGTTLEVTGFSDGRDPAVDISSSVGGGEAVEKTLKLRDSLEVDGGTWQVSEIAMTEPGSGPSSVTLVRD